jgi:hypothetical protein
MRSWRISSCAFEKKVVTGKSAVIEKIFAGNEKGSQDRGPGRCVSCIPRFQSLAQNPIFDGSQAFGQA